MTCYRSMRERNVENEKMKFCEMQIRREGQKNKQ